MEDNDSSEDVGTSDQANSGIRRRPFLKATGGSMAVIGMPSFANSDDESVSKEPWYGLPIPSGLSPPHDPTIVVGDDYGPEPVEVPPGERQYDELEGDTLREYLETIVGFSQQSYHAGNRLWGRIAGRPSLTNTINWVANQFREAGIPDVEVQQFGASNPIWRPSDWEVRLLSDSTFGDGSDDVVLESALPTDGSTLPPEGLTAPLAYVGSPTTAKINHIDVSGRIAVQHIDPRQGIFSVADVLREGTKYLIDQGAVAVLNVIELSGNMHVYEGVENVKPYAAFNLGGIDGSCLEQVMVNAAHAGSFDDLRVQLNIEAKKQKNLTAENAVGIIPGKTDKNIIINSHADGWFDAANDNGSGLAVLVGVARHFAKRDTRPERTLVFVASAGHHTPELDGATNFVQMNPDISKKNTLVINIEHPARMAINPSLAIPRQWEGDDYQLATTGTVEDPKLFGITNESPFLKDLVREGVDRYGISVISEATNRVPGDLGGYEPINSPMAQMIFADQLYQTSGDVVDTISTPGMERAARFHAFFVKQASEEKFCQC